MRPSRCRPYCGVLPGEADLLEARHTLGAGRAEEIAIGLVAAFIASAFVIEPFLAVVRRAGFVPFAWYRIAAGVLILAALAAHWL